MNVSITNVTSQKLFINSYVGKCYCGCLSVLFMLFYVNITHLILSYVYFAHCNMNLSSHKLQLKCVFIMSINFAVHIRYLKYMYAAKYIRAVNFLKCLKYENIL